MLLSQYTGGELAEKDNTRITAHLDSCALCQTEYRLQLAIDNTLQETERIPMPADVDSRILLRILQVKPEVSYLKLSLAGGILGFLIGILLPMVLMSDTFSRSVDVFIILQAEILAWAGEHSPDLVPLFESLFHVSPHYLGIGALLLLLLMYEFFEKIYNSVLFTHR